MFLNNKNSKRIRLIVCISFTLLIIGIIIYSLRDMKYIFEQIKALDSFDTTKPITFREIFKEMGISAVFAYIALQVIFVLTIVVPSTPLQMIAGISYHPVIASGILMIGIGIGSGIMFLLSRLIGTEIIEMYRKKEKNNKAMLESIDLVRSDKVNVTVFAILLYLLPVLPYGIICIILSNSSIRTWKFMTIATFASAVDVLVNTYLGQRLLRPNHVVTIIIFAVAGVCLLIIFIKTPKIINWVKRFAISKK